MKKLLFITPVSPDPNGSGPQQRAYHWIRKLSSDYDVETVIITPYGFEDTDKIPTSTYAKINISYPKLDKIMQLLHFFSSLMIGKFKGSIFFYWFPITSKHKLLLRRKYSVKKYDKILVFRLCLAEFGSYLKELTKTPITELDLDDIESIVHSKISRLLFSNGLWLRSIKSKLVAWQFLAAEKKFLPLFDAIYLCSKNDNDSLSHEFPQLKFDISPNDANGNIRPLPRRPFNHEILFVGTLSYYPNEEAVLWFAKNVLPKLKKNNPAWKFTAAGRNPSKKLKKALTRIAGAKLIENPQSLNETYLQSDIIVAPIHAGGGTKIKVLEAIAYGRPLVATAVAVYGLELIPYKHFLPAETSGEFIKQCINLSEDKAVRSIGHPKED